VPHKTNLRLTQCAKMRGSGGGADEPSVKLAELTPQHLSFEVRRAAVPATYAMATLSSVWGSAWAMTAITNLGFSAVIPIGAAGYALTGALYLVANRTRR